MELLTSVEVLKDEASFILFQPSTASIPYSCIFHFILLFNPITYLGLMAPMKLAHY